MGFRSAVPRRFGCSDVLGLTNQLRPLFRHRYLRSKHLQRGTTIVEAAIVLSLFLLLVLAIADGGRMIYAYGVMSHAAREGVRYAVVRGTDAGADPLRVGDSPTTPAQVETHVQNRAAPLSPIRAFTTWELDNVGQSIKDPGQVVEVRVEYDFNPVTPFFLPLSPIVLTSTSRTVIYF